MNGPIKLKYYITLDYTRLTSLAGENTLIYI